MTDRDAGIIGALAGCLIGVGLALFWPLSAAVTIPAATAVGGLIGFRFGASALEATLRIASMFS